jgi:hypothetical protein
MSSIFTKVPGKTIKGFGGAEYAIPFYLQFVPGYVVDVVYSDQSPKYIDHTTINTIIALPHITDKTFEERKTTAMAGESRRYYPLFRTMHDIPSKGDPVLLCTIGNVNYYLGPLNTPENNPTWNDDPNYTPERAFGTDEQSKSNNAKPQGSVGGRTHVNPNFSKERKWKRLHKYWKRSEDYTGFDRANALYETTGDTLIEGRHGNSLRIGSRADNPYIFVSNGRAPETGHENMGDGSLISITRRGTLAHHFGRMPMQKAYDGHMDVSNIGFQLGCDTVPPADFKRSMAKLVGDVNRDEEVAARAYSWEGNQMLFYSDRITINSKLEDIYMSSIQDIHIGAGRHLLVTTQEDVIINSERIFLGSPILDGYNEKLRYFETLKSDDAEERMQPMVLGQELYKILDEFMEVVRGLTTGNMWFPVKVHYQTERGDVITPVEEMIEPLVARLERIVSNKHYIEPNSVEEE